MNQMNGLNVDMDPKSVMRLMSNPSGVADMLTETSDETGDSPAEIMADIINVQRMDAKMIAEQQGVDISIKEMTPERAAQLLSGVMQGDGVDLLMVFNELEDQHNEILRESMDREDYQQFIQKKVASLHSTPADHTSTE